MSDAAREAYLKRTTPGERFDHGIELAQAAIDAECRRLGIPLDSTDERDARRLFRALRALGNR